MKRTLLLLLFGLLVSLAHNTAWGQIDSIIKIEMKLSALGVESDDFPSIDADIDFIKNTSKCKKTFYNPKYKGSIYYLNKDEMKSILKILQHTDLIKLKREYKVEESDQPTSTTIIYTKSRKFEIKDYGLRGEYPLQKLYLIVYKTR